MPKLAGFVGTLIDGILLEQIESRRSLSLRRADRIIDSNAQGLYREAFAVLTGGKNFYLAQIKPSAQCKSRSEL
jgi:hypothetical protein